jgi:hypothetical protein
MIVLVNVALCFQRAFFQDERPSGLEPVPLPTTHS